MVLSPQPPSPGSRDPSDPLGLVKTISGRSNSLAPNDDWAYRDRGPSPEKEPTNELVISRDQSTVGTPTSGVSEDADYGLEDVTPNIYQTHAGRRRAKVPDKEEDLTVAANGRVDATVPSQQPNRASPGQGHSRWKRSKTATQGTLGNKEGIKTRLRHVMLHWKKEEIRGLDKVVLHARLPQTKVKSQIGSQNYVLWQHSELESMTLQKLEDLVIEAKAQGVQESEIRLTRRLLKRVRLESERPFVGGRFLTPRALRYDVLDSSKYSADKCCIFVAFPYFEIREEQPKKVIVNDDKHPPRSLLQSIYRLNNTTERDRTQSVKMLTAKKIGSCITAEKEDILHMSRSSKGYLIFVPQLWGLILDLDRLMTLGPISDRSLQGRNVQIGEEEDSVNKKRCSLVRIHFKNQQRVENLTYPIEQCVSWFGLVNKQQQIRNILAKGRENSDPRKYKLEIHGQVIEASTWVGVQKSTKSEVLDLWMETPKQKGLKVSVESPKIAKSPDTTPQGVGGGNQQPDINAPEAEPTKAAVQQADDQDQKDHHIVVGASSASHITYDRIEKAPIVAPILQWPVVDESGNKDQCPLPERANRFLNIIYRNLPVAVGDTTGGFNSAKVTITKMAPASTTTVKTKATIAGKTTGDVVRELIQVIANKPKDNSDSATEVHKLLSQLLEAFLPISFQPESGPMRLFWGALFEIISRASASYLMDLREKISILYAWVMHIHLGVYYKRIEIAPGGREVEHDANTESAILLSSLVDAFGATFNLAVEAVIDVVGDAKQLQCGKKVSKSFEEAQSLLQIARDELIVEASGVATGEHIGPVLTPEAILILHMERLVCGVYRNGNIDIINMLEQCLEQLALKVRYRYSRRLLQLINAFEEEVAAVHDVLLQQKRVLGEFRGYLKPGTFDTPSTARKMRFEYEQKGIERILMTLREQLKNCAELQKRAKVLAVQNVHLVETLQDDNGRAIFIFTFITILFLPLSFVAGFFGMNLQGINGTTYKASLFWKIAIPFTGGILVLCFAIIVWGERLWFGITSVPRNLAKLYRRGTLHNNV